MSTHQRTLDELNQYGAILVAQARELAEKLGQPVPPERTIDVNDRTAVENAVSEAHQLITEIRMRVPADVDRVAWERTRVQDGRTGEEIFDRLGVVIHEFSQMH
jgi:hypothetical protein